ncbi:MAG: glutathione S-transferase C-terminal domain-containing protein [Pseudomonadales bacterium]|nr:glutathione S-transferase C-terminal domain-containing protein [Pseudomonadales bacterium]MBO6594371.1 glutathione S-transferase C-terminal domain-containing protein [Pseudomonadales bacterium]MBO6700872.1 glutathione S-transferase C-terminal domain-containing protein [Pseudomonadales bacterium]MBO7004808.1 glutathione S-transferase C-terminal domain-containing protein [Pseudomonadales bacterium]
MPMELWTSPTPNGWKVNIMIEELIEAGVDVGEVEIRMIDLLKGEQFSGDFTERNLNNKIPVLRDGDLDIMESCAILQYLGEKYPSPLLPDGKKRWEVIQWLTWQAANLGPVFGNKLSYTRYMEDVPPEQKAHPLARFGTEALRLVKVLDKKLDDRDWICGDEFTIADIAVYPWIRGWKWSKVNITDYPRIMAWVNRVRARPAVGRGLAFGVPEDEIDQWSEQRKKQYAKSGASIASTDNLARS